MFLVHPPKRFRTVPSLPTTRTFELKPKMNFIVVPAVWRPLHLVVMGATSTAALVRLLIIQGSVASRYLWDLPLSMSWRYTNK